MEHNQELIINEQHEQERIRCTPDCEQKIKAKKENLSPNC